MYCYFPSCNFRKNFPETAARAEAYLSTQDDVKICGCCHVTNQLPQTGDTIVTVCMSCMHILEEVRSDLPVISLFEFLLTRNDFQWPDYNGRTAVLQDCFRARGHRALQDAVRTCMQRCGMGILETEHNRDEADFDGSFLLHDPYPQNIAEAPHYFRDYLPAYVTAMPENMRSAYYRRRVSELPDSRVVCYCNTCTAGMRLGGADAIHLAELLFPAE